VKFINKITQSINRFSLSRKLSTRAMQLMIDGSQRMKHYFTVCLREDDY